MRRIGFLVGKKRQRIAEHQQATTSTMPAYFDSTMLGPPPSMPKFFKPESSVSITRKEPKESKFSSHESAIRSYKLAISSFATKR